MGHGSAPAGANVSVRGGVRATVRVKFKMRGCGKGEGEG